MSARQALTAVGAGPLLNVGFGRARPYNDGFAPPRSRGSEAVKPEILKN
jgi:hypothetical protein